MQSRNISRCPPPRRRRTRLWKAKLSSITWSNWPPVSTPQSGSKYSHRWRLTWTADRTLLKDEVLNILIAGRDTVSLNSPSDSFDWSVNPWRPRPLWHLWFTSFHSTHSFLPVYVKKCSITWARLWYRHMITFEIWSICEVCDTITCLRYRYTQSQYEAVIDGKSLFIAQSYWTATFIRQKHWDFSRLCEQLIRPILVDMSNYSPLTLAPSMSGVSSVLPFPFAWFS